MAKYSKAAQKSVASAMKRMESGKLKSGSSNKKVTNPKQAIAIGLSEAQKKGAKVPLQKTENEKVAVKKVAPKKASSKKAVAKKAASRQVAEKSLAPTKAIKKAAVKKKAPLKKVSVKKQPKKAIAPPPQEIIVLTDAVLQNNLPPVEEKSTAIVAPVEDPIFAVDKKAMIKATTKSDPKSKLHLSSNKSSIKPAGKKPLWR